ncbi:uncharacterized protein K452DRAFT_249421 [Aplosporella prunicola CBS 121167]|uniref:Uncharacterized protein n=1 Tax=Aplosporella prunicola CBS 121167 TaxID=1176127 RepID=A0A6A6BH54_9PEZI|nr:uncharacterized protein K452DRAFT_249421 [Aplosporella prunicola CBS 121167]KAF2142594.1 hypothetical protein K452DRAFT_249421 [Aplosporella prunicola CBS 121167]
MPESPHRSTDTARTLTEPNAPLPGPGLQRSLSQKQLRRATRTRKIFALGTSFFFLLSVIFLILVEVGNTFNKDVARDTYFIKLDLSNIVPTSYPDAVLLNSIAQTLGLHDFYQVGLWNFCEGYNGAGITHCSKPKALYWFNPVEILLNELLAGATIAIPEDALKYLDIVETVSHWMFGLFLTGACMACVMIFITPLSVYTRWATLPIAIFSFVTALFITVATVLASAMFIIFKNALGSISELNLGAEIGKRMFAFMWIASVAAILATLVQTGLCCCCASRRDVRRGKKTGSKKAYTMTDMEKGTP